MVGALAMGAFAITAILTAWIDNRFPLRGLAFLILSAVLTWQTWELHDRELEFEDAPLAFMRLVKFALELIA